METTQPEQVVDKVTRQTRHAHVRNLSRLANLSVPIIHGSKEHNIRSSVQEIVSHGATTVLFGEIFNLLLDKNGSPGVSREELDQKLMNWILKVPGVSERFGALDGTARDHVERFRSTDMKSWDGKVDGFKRPLTPAVAKKCGEMKKAWEAQLKKDGGRKFKEILEANGERVVYIENTKFENWGDTVNKTPSVQSY
jgi:hypothetical protein